MISSALGRLSPLPNDNEARAVVVASGAPLS
jgi:hypothetical protein